MRSPVNGGGRLTSGTAALTTTPLHLESKCTPSPGGQRLRDGRSPTPRRPPKGYHALTRGQSWHEPGSRLRRGLPTGQRAVGLRQVDGMPREPQVRFGGANPERTTCERLSRPETHEQEHAGQQVHDGTRHHQASARVHVRDEDIRANREVGLCARTELPAVAVAVASIGRRCTLPASCVVSQRGL